MGKMRRLSALVLLATVILPVSFFHVSTISEQQEHAQTPSHENTAAPHLRHKLIHSELTHRRTNSLSPRRHLQSVRFRKATSTSRPMHSGGFCRHLQSAHSKETSPTHSRGPHSGNLRKRRRLQDSQEDFYLHGYGGSLAAQLSSIFSIRFGSLTFGAAPFLPGLALSLSDLVPTLMYDMFVGTVS